ncbi:ABC-2 type transport system permease protein [Prauserella isguenensis]|uniref:Transport permease protein n=1 Tax=Prauserella isguenensis TaxID=1470180 RepID=A0A839S3Y4_9PSEU|nr:ABC transporter permease [Prauserella isguenensis]MBB3051993.1 ABC-2 type transport system permease protein [Prauserella isguenensis]
MTTTSPSREAQEPTSVGNGAGALTGLRVFTARSLKHSFRDAESLLMAILLPVMLMLIFVLIFGESIAAGQGGDRSDYLAYVLPAVALTAAGFGASYTAVVVSNDMTTGFMNRLRTMPFPAVTVLLGHTAASMVRNLLATGVVLAVAFALGFRTDAGVAEFAGAVGLIALWILVITVVFAVLGMTAGSAEAASSYGFVLLFLPYVSSGFAPVETMPGWLQGFAGHQPMTPIIDASRALLEGATPGDAWWVGLLWCGGFIAVAVWLAAVLFPRKVAR